MKPPHSLALLLLALGCLDLTPPPPTVTPQLTDLQPAAGSLDAVPRVPELRVRFDRPMAPPEPSSVMLFREPWSSALVADARDGVVTVGRLAHRVSLRVERDGADPARWRLDTAEVLPPSIPLTLVFSQRTMSVEGRAITDDLDAGVAARGVALTVVDAPVAGPVVTPAIVESPVDLDAASFWLRCDRPVRVLRPDGVTLVGDDGVITTRVEADERRPDGLTRVLRVYPTRAMRADLTYGWRLAGLTSRDATDAEAVPWRMLAGPSTAATAVALVDGVVCASGETAMGGACVEIADTTVVVRAATTSLAVTRLALTSADGQWRWSAVDSSATSHRLSVSGLAPSSDFAWRLEAWDAGGRLRDAREGTLRTADAAPRVRLDEVLARPHSTSAQEFVEVVSDEDAEVSLEGWVLDTGNGRSVLPAGAAVGAHGRAVIVGATFDPRGVAQANDPAVAAGARVVVVRGSLAGRGLRDTGAELALVTPTGLVVSRYPGTAPELVPVEGVSVVRADLELDESDPAAWVRSRDGASSPGGANVTR